MKSKQLLFTLVCLLLAGFGTASAQQAEGISYQAVIRSSTGSPLSSTAVNVQFTVMQGSMTGTTVYSESQVITTTSQGLINANIGSGTTISGTWDKIQWNNGPYYINVKADASGGTSFTDLGTTQLASVPFSKQSGGLTLFAGGTSNPSQMVITHSSGMSTTGVRFNDTTKAFEYVSAGVKTSTMELASGNISTKGDVSATGNLNATGNVMGTNVTGTGTVSGATVSATGNVSAGGNVTGVNLTGSGTVTGATLSSTGNISAGGNVTGVNLTGTGTVSGATLSSTGNISASGNITGTNLTGTGTLTGATLAATGNISAGGNVTGVNVTGTGTVSGATVSSTGNITASGNVNAVNLSGSGNVSAGGSVSGTTLAASTSITGASLTTTGNITAGANVNVTGKVTRGSDPTNMLPIAWGTISATGTILTGSGNISVTHAGTGAYQISITGETFVYSNYTTIATLAGSIGFIQTSSGAGMLNVFNYSPASLLTDGIFQFVVYKK